MDKRYQVFVSSTYTDLKEERRQVMQALLKLNCIPAGMELFNATNQDQWELIRGVIEDSDYYVVIVGARYGSLTDEGISYTEKEYDYAVKRGKNILGFVHAKPGSIAIDKGETSDEGRRNLDAFVKKVMGRPVVRWESAGELAGQVGLSVASEMNKFPAVGWVRGDWAMKPETAAEIRELRAKVAQLEAEITLKEQTHKSQIAESGIDLEEVAQGKDEYEVEYTYQDASWTWCRMTETYTWDVIFKVVGPGFVDETPEAELRSRLNKDLAVAARDQGKIVREAQASSYDIDAIKVHLMTLGLIQIGDRSRPPSDTRTYLKLSDKGAAHLRRIMLVTRSVPVEPTNKEPTAKVVAKKTAQKQPRKNPKQAADEDT